MTTPAVLREITRATRHHGVTTSEALRLSEHQIGWACKTGVLLRTHRNVLVNPAVPVTPQQRLAIAVAAGGRMAAGWARSAAAVWAIWDEFPTPPEIVVPRRRLARIPGVTVHRSTDLCWKHVMIHKGIRVTKPLITVLDLGVVLDPEDIGEVIVRGGINKLFTLEGVKATLARLARSGRTGVTSVRAAVAILEALGQPPDSVLEYRMALLANQFALPPMTFQHQVVLWGRRYRIDFSYPGIMLAIEVDGWGKVTDPEAYARSLQRQNALIMAGWTVLRFDWSRIVNRPHEVAAEILAVLGTLGFTFSG